jgi:hypothetical protein
MNSNQAINRAIGFLQAAQNNDGGWGYALGQSSTMEATAAAVISLRGLVQAQALHDQALAWLLASQNRDGGWGLNADDDQSSWQTAWAVLALSRSAPGRDALARGENWLLTVDAFNVSGEDLRQDLQELLGVDSTLKGWPWRPGEASFVEPTALALLALPANARTREFAGRLDEAIRYLVDRRCAEGGWNVGNPRMFSQMLPPRAEPTAWTLLALANREPAAILEEDWMALRAQMELDGGAQALGWGVLALKATGQEDIAEERHLLAKQNKDGSWDGNPYHTVVSVLALRENVSLGGA